MSGSVRIWIALVWIVASGTPQASMVFTLAELQGLLQAAPRLAVPFAELRESPWLATPEESRGTLHSLPGVLEKRVEVPRPQTVRLRADRLEWVGPDGAAGRQILFSSTPAVGALANVLRHAVAGDLGALEQDFRIELQGSRQAWGATLWPLRSDAARHLDSLRIEGSGGKLRAITLLERNGARTTTHIFH